MSDYFPFGSQRMPKGDDNLSDPFYLSQKINYFGEPVAYVHVSINGYIAMGNSFSGFTPDPLTKHVIIAPFFTDVDTRAAGNVYYGEECRQDLLDKAAREVEKQSSYGFKPTLLFIATWDGVGYYASKSDKTNTFQAVIASDGYETHVLMYYKRISWTSPDNMNGQNGRLNGSDKTKLPILGVGDGKGREHRVCGQIESTILGLPNSRGRLSDKNGLWTFVVSDPEIPTKSVKDKKAGDEFKGDSLLATNEKFPETLLFNKMVDMTFGSEGGTEGDMDNLGLMIEVPKDAVPKALTIESRVSFGGPFLVDEDIQAISPPYLFSEMTPPQTLRKDMTLTMKHSANLPSHEDRDSVFFVCFSSNLTNGRYVSKVVSGNEARFQINDQFGELKLRALNQNCHVMMVRRVARGKKASEVMKTTLKFMATFYKARVQRETRLVPFTSFSIYPNHPTDRQFAVEKILKELKESGLRLVERDDEWCANKDCIFAPNSNTIAVVPSMHPGWDIEYSHGQEIQWDNLWDVNQARYKNGLKGLEGIAYQKTLRMKFHKLAASRVCYKQCTVSANGFTDKVQTSVHLHWDQEHEPVKAAFEDVLKEAMMQLSNEFQVSNFTEFMGVDHSIVEGIRMEYDRQSGGSSGYDVVEMTRDQLTHFILQLHSYIQRNSRKLNCSEEKVRDALTRVQHGDNALAEEFSRKLRIQDVILDSLIGSNSRSALYMPPISQRTRSRAAYPSLAEEDAVSNSQRRKTRGHRRSLSGY